MFAQGEDEFQSAAFAVAHGDRPAVDHDGVFDDRKPESRAAQLARAPLVDTVEPLEEVREVFFVDADAVVGEKYRACLCRVRKQADEDVAPARVGRGVVRQVAEDGTQQRGLPSTLTGPRKSQFTRSRCLRGAAPCRP